MCVWLLLLLKDHTFKHPKVFCLFFKAVKKKKQEKKEALSWLQDALVHTVNCVVKSGPHSHMHPGAHVAVLSSMPNVFLICSSLLFFYQIACLGSPHVFLLQSEHVFHCSTLHCSSLKFRIFLEIEQIWNILGGWNLCRHLISAVSVNRCSSNINKDTL